MRVGYWYNEVGDFGLSVVLYRCLSRLDNCECFKIKLIFCYQGVSSPEIMKGFTFWELQLGFGVRQRGMYGVGSKTNETFVVAALSRIGEVA
jgi:hypothetical protein